MSLLCAILCSPPTTAGQQTKRQLSVVADLLGCDDLLITNIFAVPTVDLPSINLHGKQASGWMSARPEISAGIRGSAEVLVGWGVSKLHGAARSHRDRQISWVADLLAQHSMNRAWCIGGQPRHPSRWHQYVSNKHGRTTGGSFPDRLGQVLTSVTVSSPEGFSWTK